MSADPCSDTPVKELADMYAALIKEAEHLTGQAQAKRAQANFYLRQMQRRKAVEACLTAEPAST